MNTLTKHFAAPLALALATTSITACSQDSETSGNTDETHVDQTLAQVVGDADNMSTVASALSDSGLDSVFDGPGAYTILAPNDAAFEALGDEAEALTGEEQRPILVAVLRSHILPGHLTPDAIQQAIKDSGGVVKMRTLGKGTVTFSNGEEGLLVTGPDGAEASLAGEVHTASNGVLIPLDGLLETPKQGS